MSSSKQPSTDGPVEARFIDSTASQRAVPRLVAVEPAATPTVERARIAAPVQRWTPTACASCASVSCGERCATTTTICSTANCFRGPTRRAADARSDRHRAQRRSAARAGKDGHTRAACPIPRIASRSSHGWRRRPPRRASPLRSMSRRRAGARRVPGARESGRRARTRVASDAVLSACAVLSTGSRLCPVGTAVLRGNREQLTLRVHAPHERDALRRLQKFRASHRRARAHPGRRPGRSRVARLAELAPVGTSCSSTPFAAAGAAKTARRHARAAPEGACARTRHLWRRRGVPHPARSRGARCPTGCCTPMTKTAPTPTTRPTAPPLPTCTRTATTTQRRGLPIAWSRRVPAGAAQCVQESRAANLRAGRRGPRQPPTRTRATASAARVSWACMESQTACP